MVDPIASEVKQAVSTMSRAVAANAQDQVNTVRTTNQEASSGKWVCTECGSRAPAACGSTALANVVEGGGYQTYRESVKNSNRQPETPPHRIDHRHQRISCFKSFDTRNELRKTYSQFVSDPSFDSN